MQDWILKLSEVSGEREVDWFSCGSMVNKKAPALGGGACEVLPVQRQIENIA
ncbi:hypothetical protein [Paenibacillus sp. ACRRY]|uniref:hypothetical protein n=1 Tax=Paenibacillus sp. ACRRY TaxID=2918208 RepID=UPI001EF6BEE6|nr:hypothetical protein [Paenibacillus sp. ACRRY]